eukprot:5657440-Amphidinium_carterae.1
MEQHEEKLGTNYRHTPRNSKYYNMVPNQCPPADYRKYAKNQKLSEPCVLQYYSSFGMLFFAVFAYVLQGVVFPRL